MKPPSGDTVSASSKRVTVGLSGGVDSSVAAYLLMQQGYAVDALFMKNWEEDDAAGYCAAEVDYSDAIAVAEKLGIILQGRNFSSEYWERVFENFLSEYGAGRTPNPDILCNREIKFRAFLDYALEAGADYIATGHYARIREQQGLYSLLRGVDNNKDQSYFLYTLNQQQLANSLFPLGELEKGRVRQIARELQLATHDKKDSTGICFIGERRFRDFLQRYLPAQPGVMVTVAGEEIGTHQGLMYYTLGQRQGLGIGGVAGYPEAPWYVVAKDLSANRLMVAQGHDHPLLYADTLSASQLHWIAGAPPQDQQGLTARIRYRQTDQACTIKSGAEATLQVQFAAPQWAITPGQSVVFYQQEVCLGGGIIN
ncbi:MAG: tRNA 2-thiouridine(34) synthase MnmA [Gammaproteobacteria bacterium]|nr:tRNA 2-thiouridine(34) synthase MnmA [Gammaproteobacteria bacterium]